jgi:hypothetical protein
LWVGVVSWAEGKDYKAGMDGTVWRILGKVFSAILRKVFAFRKGLDNEDDSVVEIDDYDGDDHSDDARITVAPTVESEAGTEPSMSSARLSSGGAGAAAGARASLSTPIKPNDLDGVIDKWVTSVGVSGQSPPVDRQQAVEQQHQEGGERAEGLGAAAERQAQAASPILYNMKRTI